jgi:RNA polymerase sigma-70 factor, ECF subfamily
MPDEKPSPAAGMMTQYLRAWRAGDEGALARLTSEIYGELRRLAANVMAKHPANPTIQPTSLVHELYLQLPDVRVIDWQSRAHFLNVAAKMMRNILVDHARKRNALKRGGTLVSLETDVEGEDPALQIDILLIDNALDQFAEAYPRHARVVELRFFGGLTAEETADVLRVMGVESSLRTVERDWTFARGWLKNAIRPV